MDPKSFEKEAFRVAGLAIRTSEEENRRRGPFE